MASTGQIVEGAIAISNLLAPNIYVSVLTPTPQVVGVATTVGGLVGTASWGPKNTALFCGSLNDVTRQLGKPIPPVNLTGQVPAITNPYDLPAAAAAFFSQSGAAGGLSLQAVRVSDGTDAAATHVLQDSVPATGITITGLYTGSLANQFTISIATSPFTDAGLNIYFNVTITPPGGYGLNTEYYPNIKGTTTGSANSPFWVSLQAALLGGIPNVCGPSQLVNGTGASTTAKNPAIVTNVTMSGGVDGATTPATILTAAVGSAAANPYTGLFALMGSSPPPAVACIAGYGTNAADLSTNNSIIQTFVDQSGTEFYADFPLGESTAGAVTIVQTAASGGLFDYNFTFLKDWAYFNDGVSGLRFVPMAPFAMGVRCSNPPWVSLLNLPVKGIIGTYRTTGSGKAAYSNPEIGLCNSNGITLVTAPSPGGPYVGFCTAVNSSMQINQATGPEEYASMTNYLARTFAASFGPVVGQNQSNSPVDPLRKRVRDSFNGFLTTLKTQQPPAIDSFSVQCDNKNNLPAGVAAHVMVCAAVVKYLASVWYFIVQLIGGTTVQVSLQQGT